MIRLSLTDFVDIISKSGTPKATKVKEVKLRPDYEPAFDFYKPLREFIIDIHKTNKSKKDIDRIIPGLSDKKKITSYKQIIDGYKKWWGRNTLEWFEPPRSSYQLNGIEVTINPELGLRIKNEEYVIKLYFKAEALSKFKSDIITNLMVLNLLSKRNLKMSVLDTRNSKLYTYGGTSNIKPVIDAELAYIESLWGSI